MDKLAYLFFLDPRYARRSDKNKYANLPTPTQDVEEDSELALTKTLILKQEANLFVVKIGW
nr:hypothetical protein [uncultured Cellulosilyticum sp.]